MFALTAAILLIFKLFLAGKDATSYLLKEIHEENSLTLSRIKRWHRDGIAIDAIFSLVLCWASNDWSVILQSLLLRLAVFDPAFNHWAGLNIRYLGSTALWDRMFIRIFGINGALKKSAMFLVALILWGIIKAI